jgi:WD40 repeat protein
VNAPDDTPARQVLQRLLSTLARTGSAVRWDLATPYLLRHAVEHAARAGRDSLTGLLADDEYLVNADPASITAALPPFRDVFPHHVKEILDVYCASVGWHQWVDARARRQILALDAVRLGHRELAARMRRTPGGRPLPWQCAWSTAANVSAASGATMTGHAGRVIAMAVADFGDGPVAVTGSDDRTARIWDLDAARTRHVLLHSQPVTAIAAGSIGGNPYLLTAAAGLVKWAPLTGRPTHGIAALTGVRHIDVDEPSAAALVATRSSALVVEIGGDLRTRPFEVPVSATVDFTAVGREASLALGLLVTRDSHVTVFSLNNGRVHHRTRFRPTDRITSFRAADVGGQTIAALGCESGACVVFHAQSGHVLHTLRDPGMNNPRRSAVRSLGLFPTHAGWRAATGHQDGSLRIWDLGSGALLSSIRAHADDINAITTGSIANTGVFLTVSDDDTARCWDVDTGALRAVFAGHTSGVTASELTHVGDRPVLVTVSRDRTVRTWDARGEQSSPEVPGHPRWVRSLELHPVHGRLHIITTCFDDAVRVIDTAQGEIVKVFRASDDRPLQTARAITTDGRTLIAAGGLRGSLLVWDFDSPGWRRSASAGRADITALAFTPDDRVMAGDNDGVVTAWSPTRGGPPEVLFSEQGKGGGVSSMTVVGTARAPLLVTGYHNGHLRLTSLRDSRTVRTFRHPGAVRSIAANRSASLVAAGTGAEIHLHHIGRGPISILRGHSAVVRSLCFATFGGKDALFSGSADGTVRVWEPTTGEQVHRIDLPDIVQNVDYRDGVLAVGYGREVSVFNPARPQP